MDEERKEGIPKPVNVGDEVEVTIESSGRQGDGIAKVNGFVVFVKGAGKGENCKIKITEVKRTFATGEKVGAGEAPAEAPKEEAPAEEKEEAPAEEAKEEAPAEAPAEEKKDNFLFFLLYLVQ